MYEVLVAKFANQKMRSLLQQSKPKILVEANTISGRDSIWSNNYDGEGYNINILGLLLMHIRDGSNDELVNSLRTTGLKIFQRVPTSTVYGTPLFPRTQDLLKEWRSKVPPTPRNCKP